MSTYQLWSFSASMSLLSRSMAHAASAVSAAAENYLGGQLLGTRVMILYLFFESCLQPEKEFMPRIKFVAPKDFQFRNVLQTRLDSYFRERHLSKHWDWRMATKVLCYVGGYIGIYSWIIVLPHSNAAYIGGMACMGLLTAGVGFNVGHDAAHHAFSEKAWINRFFSHAFSLIGVHVYTWRIIHNVIHHTYTNIPGADGDLNTVAALRYHDKVPAKSYHRYQYIYAFGLYCLASLMWVFSKDFVHMRKKEHCGYKKPKPPVLEWFFLLAGKLLHYNIFIFVPWLILGLPLSLVLSGFLLLHIVAGFCLASVFAVGHMVDDIPIIVPDSDGQIQDQWAAHQLRTSANFASQSSFFFWTVGGLNFQIEHHLFPTVCHVHYQALAPIVRATAEEFSLPYYCYGSFPKALAAHVRYLKRFGGLKELHPSGGANTL